MSLNIKACAITLLPLFLLISLPAIAYEDSKPAVTSRNGTEIHPSMEQSGGSSADQHTTTTANKPPVASTTINTAAGTSQTKDAAAAAPAEQAPAETKTPITAEAAPVEKVVEEVDPCEAYKGYYESYIVCQDRIMKIQRMMDASKQRQQRQQPKK